MKTGHSPRKVFFVAHYLASRLLPGHSCKFSRHDFTLAQLLACLVLREFFDLSYRRTEALLIDSPAWLADVGLTRAPDHNTLWRVFEFLLSMKRCQRLLDRIVVLFAESGLLTLGRKPMAMDSTCFERHHRSAHYDRRCRRMSEQKTQKGPGKWGEAVNAERSRRLRQMPMLAIAVVSGKGDGSEARAFIRRLKKDCVYVVDRNFVHFGFINAVREAGSNLVLRLRKDTTFAVSGDRALSDNDRAHGVTLDQTGTLCGTQSRGNKGRAARTGKPPGDAIVYRRVVIRDDNNDTDLILLTDLLEAPAYVIGAIYRRRWQIELFLRWLKVFACFEHLISQSPRGITTQFYVAVLLTLLLHLRTGVPVSKHTLHIVSMSAAGELSDEAMTMLLARRERERELERARRAKARPA